jgi:hypothetical protein
MELDILKLLSTKDNYNKYNTLIVTDRLSEEFKLIIESLEEYFEESTTTEVDWDSFYTWYTVIKHPALSSSKSAVIKEICDRLKTMPSPTGSSALKNFSLRDHAAQIGDMAFEIVDGNPKYTLDDMDALILSCIRSQEDLSGAERDDHESSGDLLKRLGSLKHGRTFDWRLNELQTSVGPIKQGDFIIIGARPDSGKTTFLASEGTFLASQLVDDECVLWFNNEEAIERIRGRQTQAALNWTQAEILHDPVATVDAYTKALGGNIERLKVIDKTFMSINDIDRALQRNNAKIIIIDQLWKLRGFERESSSDIDRYAMLASYLRDLAKKHGPIIGTSQIDEKAEGVRYPDMGRLYNSKTAVQGEADVILMIGRDHDESPNVRFISTPKNKLSLGDPRHRNSGWAVGIDQERARFNSKIPRPPKV